jgi:hypothetical protein
LDRLYRLPRPCDTLEDWYRATHQDISDLTPEEIEDERIRVRIRLAFTPGDAWLAERIKKLRAALLRTRGRS